MARLSPLMTVAPQLLPSDAQGLVQNPLKEVERAQRDALSILDIKNDPYRGLYGIGVPQRADARDLFAFDTQSNQISELSPAEAKSIFDTIKGAANTGLSLLATAANVIDKPAAATRGLLAGDLSQLSLMLPFSESYLKPFYEKQLGIQIPDHHITGREVLERWGARKNKPGFHPLDDPADAVLDVMGLALEVAALPPYVPRVGVLTKAGEKAYRLSGEAAKASAMADMALASLGRNVDAGVIAKLNPKQIANMGIRDIVVSVAKNAGADDTALKAIDEYVSRMDPAAANSILNKLRDAITRKDSRAVGGILETLPTISRIGSATSEARSALPAVSMLGRAEELQQGLRGFRLEPIGIGRLLGLPQIEMPMVGAGKALEAVQSTLPVRFVRNIFDWTTRDTLGAFEQAGAQRATETARLAIGGLADLHTSTQAYMGSLSDMFAKYQQLATLGNNETGIKSFSQVMTYLAEHSRRFTGENNQRYEQLAKQLFGTAKPDKGMIDFAQEATTLVERSLVDSINVARDVARSMGLKLGDISEFMTGYFPRYTESTLAGRVGADVGPGRSVIQSAKQQRRQWAFRYVPGGTVTINAASHDPILRAVDAGAVARKMYGVDDLLFKDANNRVFVYGDYIRANNPVTGDEVFGRMVGVKGGKIAVMPMVGTKPVVVDPASALRVAPPSDMSQYIKISQLNHSDAYRLAKRWLKEHSIEVKVGKKPSFKQREAVVQQYITHRYAEPYITSDAARKAFFASEGTFSNFKEAVEYFKNEMQVSDNEARRLAKIALQSGGTSGELLRRLRADNLPNYFATDVLANHYKYMTQMAENIAAVSGVHEVLRRAALRKPTSVASWFGLGKNEEYVTLAEAWKSIKFPRGKAVDDLTDVGLQTLVDSILKHDPKSAQALQGMTFDEIAEVFTVPKSAVKASSRLLEVLLPENRASLPIEEALNSITSVYRSWMTVPRVSFHVRNFYSNMLMGATADAPYSVNQYFDQFRRVVPRMIDGEFDQIPYFDEMVRQGVLGTSASFEDVVLKNTQPGRPLTLQAALQSEIPPAGKEVLSPLAAGRMSDFLTLSPTKNPLIKSGNNAFKWVEAVGRAIPYAAAREAGMTPAQAKDLVSRVLYDYSRLSTTEKRWIRPNVMFYSWIRQNLGYMVPRVMLDWKSGPALTTWGVGRLWAQTPEEMPDWLQDQLAIPIRKDPDGKTVVVRSLGLPIQDLAVISPSLAKTSTNILGRMHPFIRTAVTFATGDDPFTGMPAEKVQALLTKAGINTSQTDKRVVQAAIDLFPASSMISYLSKVFDSNRSPFQRTLDFASGVKVGRYDLEEQRMFEALEQLKQRIIEMPGARMYESPYAVPMAPEETQRMVALYQIGSQLRKQYSKKKLPLLQRQAEEELREEAAETRKQERTKLLTSPVLLGE